MHCQDLHQGQCQSQLSNTPWANKLESQARCPEKRTGVEDGEQERNLESGALAVTAVRGLWAASLSGDRASPANRRVPRERRTTLESPRLLGRRAMPRATALSRGARRYSMQECEGPSAEGAAGLQKLRAAHREPAAARDPPPQPVEAGGRAGRQAGGRARR